MTEPTTSQAIHDRGQAVRDTAIRRIAATICSMALIFSMLAFVPGIVLVIYAGGGVCFVTGVVALACIRATPRLAIATLYWSAATFLAPLIVYLGGWAIGCVALVGFLLLIGLAAHYDAA